MCTQFNRKWLQISSNYSQNSYATTYSLKKLNNLTLPWISGRMCLEWVCGFLNIIMGLWILEYYLYIGKLAITSKWYRCNIQAEKEKIHPIRQTLYTYLWLLSAGTGVFLLILFFHFLHFLIQFHGCLCLLFSGYISLVYRRVVVRFQCFIVRNLKKV